jgi:AraC-like DNA-binding protein
MWSDEYGRRAAEMRQRGERERLASRLGHEQLRIAEATAGAGAVERHYTVKDLAALSKLSTTTVARLFRNEPGVLKIGRDQPRRGRRSNTTLCIPESVVQRVYRRLVVQLGDAHRLRHGPDYRADLDLVSSPIPMAPR